MTGTLEAEVVSRIPEGASGRVRLDLPDGWADGPLQADYEVSGRGESTVSFTVRVPDDVVQGSYPVRLSAAPSDPTVPSDPAGQAGQAGPTVENSGMIDVLPVMDLSPAAGPMEIDGDLADWAGIEPHAIPSTTSGRVRCRAATTTAAQCSAQPTTRQTCSCRGRAGRRGGLQHCSGRHQGHWRSDAVEICVDPSGRSDNTLTVFKAGIFPGTTAGREPRAARDADARQA